jgi:hypothetical protein
MRLRAVLGSCLAIVFVFIVVDPRNVISLDLRDNLIAETLGAAFTLLVVDLLFEAQQTREEERSAAELRRSLLHALDADLHALWSLLLPEPLARDDPLRRAPREQRVRRFLRELAAPETWANAPSAHAKAVRARLRDLGEDAERMLLVSEDAADIGVRARLEDVRRACRTLDEDWERTPRGELAPRFARTIGAPLGEIMDRFDQAASPAKAGRPHRAAP